jgi:hypothetical protein
VNRVMATALEKIMAYRFVLLRGGKCCYPMIAGDATGISCPSGPIDVNVAGDVGDAICVEFAPFSPVFLEMGQPVSRGQCIAVGEQGKGVPCNESSVFALESGGIGDLVSVQFEPKWK